MIQAIIFDLDGTLVQSEKLKALSYAIAVQQIRGLSEPEPDAIEAYREIVGAARDVASRHVLRQLGLSAAFRTDPREALARLHERTLDEMTSDRLFALAECSFVHAERTGQRDYFLATSIYAYTFLFPEDGSDPPNEFDPRLRTAVDLYNRSVARALIAEGDDDKVYGRPYAFHLGTLDLTVDDRGLSWANRRLDQFVPAAQLEVRGLRNRFRHAGIGAPFIARAGSEPGHIRDVESARVIEGVRVPVTFVIRYADARGGLSSGHLSGTVSAYTENVAHEIEVAGRTVPLEYETTTALAYALETSRLSSFGRRGFRRGDALQHGFRGVEGGLFVLRPHVRGRIPVVLVHGTASSPARWAEMLNELQADPVIAERYEFWLFIYATGNPVPYSASLLRTSLRNAVADLDPEGRDAALRRMVLVGHSQGGLLIELQVISSRNRFWKLLSERPFDEVQLESETRELLSEVLFFEPLPFAEQVIFIATPHRGSFVAGNWLGRFAATLFEAPEELLALSVELARASVAAGGNAVAATLEGIDSVLGDEDGRLLRRLDRIPSSLENMAPDSPFIQILASTPPDPRVRVHTIIPVRGGPPPEGQNDGVVTFESAHREGADSELVIFHSGHSPQADPPAIQEVRRILLDSLK